jgi:hypothetical protein
MKLLDCRTIIDTKKNAYAPTARLYGILPFFMNVNCIDNMINTATTNIPVAEPAIINVANAITYDPANFKLFFCPLSFTFIAHLNVAKNTKGIN